MSTNLQDFTNWTYTRKVYLHRETCSYCGVAEGSFLVIEVPLVARSRRTHRQVRYCHDCEVKYREQDAALAMFAVAAGWDVE